MPRVEHLGEVVESRVSLFAQALADAQRKVESFVAVEALPEAAKFLNQCATVDGKRSDVIHRQQEVGRPVRFEKGIPAATSGSIDRVLVDIEEVGFGSGSEGASDLEQGKRREKSPRIDDGNIRACSEGNDRVRECRETAAFGKRRDVDSGIRADETLDDVAPFSVITRSRR